MPASRESCRSRGFPGSLFTHKSEGPIFNDNGTGMEARNTSEAQHQPQNWAQQIRRRILERGVLRPLRPNLSSLSLDPKLHSVAIFKIEKISFGNLPDLECWFTNSIQD
jgi:hypothetical protein